VLPAVDGSVAASLIVLDVPDCAVPIVTVFGSQSPRSEVPPTLCLMNARFHDG
jgi:hypothetical protein